MYLMYCPHDFSARLILRALCAGWWTAASCLSYHRGLLCLSVCSRPRCKASLDFFCLVWCWMRDEGVRFKNGTCQPWPRCPEGHNLLSWLTFWEFLPSRTPSAPCGERIVAGVAETLCEWTTDDPDQSIALCYP